MVSGIHQGSWDISSADKGGLLYLWQALLYILSAHSSLNHCVSSELHLRHPPYPLLSEASFFPYEKFSQERL